jgi:hypothetical protein
MSVPSPKRPNEVTLHVSNNGLCIDCTVDVYEISTEIPERLKPTIERLRRALRDGRPLPSRIFGDERKPVE